MKRFKFVICLFGILAGFMFFINPVVSKAKEPLTLNIIENDWPPYYFAGKADMPEGIAKELLKECIPKIGYNYEFNFYPVKRMYSYMKKGKIDITLFSYKKDRESFVVYGKTPLFTTGYRPVVLAKSNIQIRSLQDFDVLKVGHLAGLRYSKEYLKYIEKRKKEGTIVTTTIGKSNIKMLLNGMIDIFVDTKDTVLWRAKQMDALDKIKILDFDIRTKEYFVTVSKQSKIKDKEGFLLQLDQCIRAAKKDGTLVEITRKYGID